MIDFYPPDLCPLYFSDGPQQSCLTCPWQFDCDKEVFPDAEVPYPV